MNGLLDKIKFINVIQALRPEIRTELKNQGPNTFSSAIQMATNIESDLEDIVCTNIVPQLEISHLMQQHLKTNDALQRISETVHAFLYSTSQWYSGFFISKSISSECHLSYFS